MNNNTKKDIFIISSPFQMISTLEAIKYFNIEHYEIFLLFDFSELNKMQMEKTIKLFKVKNIQYFFKKNKNKIFFRYEELRLISLLLLKKHTIKKIFIGDYYAPIARIIAKLFQNHDIYLLDDGVATIQMQNDFTKNSFQNLFTMFNLPAYEDQKIFVHDFQHLKTRFINSNIKMSKNIFLLGAKLPEVDIVSTEYYYEILKKIKIKYQNEPVYYIPHRGEEIKKINYIEKNIGFIIKKIDYPVELIFQEGILGTTIISFISTALISLNKIYEDIDIYAIRLDYDELKKNKEAIINLYNELERYVNVIDIERI